MVEINLRVAYAGKNRDGKPENGMVDVVLMCEENILVGEALAAARVKALKNLHNIGRSEVRIGNLYSGKPSVPSKLPREIKKVGA